MNNKPIGVFDSGIGGLTVLKEIIKILPNEQYIYYDDTKNVPYGIKTKEEVKLYIQEAVEFFIKKEVKAIVIACNTATSVAITDLRKKYIIPIIGIEPAIKPAIENRNSKKVLILATTITIKEKKLHNLIQKLNAEKFVSLIALPKLVEFAEKGEFESNSVKKYLQEQLQEYNLQEYSQVVLGCTHFPLFKNMLSEIFLDNTQIVDGSLGVAKRLKSVLNKEKLLGNIELKIDYYVSGVKVNNIDKYSSLLEKI